MLVTIIQAFDQGPKRWQPGENPDVDLQTARQWIAAGLATLDTDGQQSWPSTPLAALVSEYGIASPRMPAPNGSRITVSEGRVLVGGVPYRGTFINAHDQFNELLQGDNFYLTQLPAIAAKGVRLIRTSMGPLNSAEWITQVGTSGTAPVGTFLTNLRTFLDAAQASNLGVILVLFWKAADIPVALGSTQADYLTPGSTTRAYMAQMAALIARTFRNHPALAAYHIGNEWFDLASIARFASATTNTALDHLGALTATINDIVAGIRQWDNDRAIISPHGSSNRFEAGNVPTWVRKFVSTVGNCDIAGYHLYPDTDRSGFTHIGTGSAVPLDMGATTPMLSTLRSSLLRAGKALIVDECAADDDYSTYSGKPVGTLSRICWERAHAAGVELVGDWGYYADDALYATSVANLRLLRSATLDSIASYNATLTPGFVPPPMVYPPMGQFPVPAVCARGSGAANSWVRIPNHPDLSIDASATARMWWMFWVRKRAILSATARLLANNDGSNHGVFFSSNAAEGLTASLGFGTGFINPTGSGNFFSYPADTPVDGAVTLPWEWALVGIQWDGVVTPTPGGDNSQHTRIFVNGYQVFAQATTGRAPSAASTRDMYLMSSSDGLANFAAVDMFDVMVGKGSNALLTTDDQWAYIQRGVVPPSAQHRWKLNGNTLDSIGNLHAFAGSALTFVPNGIGNQP